MEDPEKKAHILSNGLWAPTLIISIGFIVSLIFVVQALKGYKKPRPLLIKPSSVETFEGISEAIHKALYPIKQRKYGAVFTSPKNSPFEENLKASLTKIFPKTDKNISFTFTEIDLSEEPNLNETDCLNTALFNMKRKPKKWNKNIYFSVCTEGPESFSLYYTIKK